MFFYLYRHKRILKNSKKNIKYFIDKIRLEFEIFKFKIKFNKEKLIYDFIYDFFILLNYKLDDNSNKITYVLDTGDILEIIIYKQDKNKILSRYDSMTIKLHNNMHIIESLKLEFKLIKSISCEWYRNSDRKRYVLELIPTTNRKEVLEMDNRLKKYFIIIFDIIMKGVDEYGY